jgi:hypothetical protein
MNEERHEKKAYWLVEAPILDWRGHQRPLPFHPLDREGGRAFGFFMLSEI